MLTKIFHCDRDKTMASLIAPKADDQLPDGWARLRLALPEGGYDLVFCERCTGFLDETLQAFGMPPLPRPRRATQ